MDYLARVRNGEISREVSAIDITKGDPSRERVLGRLETFLSTGVIIDPEEFEKVAQRYQLTRTELSQLGAIYMREGLNEGTVQEPGNLVNLGRRLALVPYLFNKVNGEE